MSIIQRLIISLLWLFSSLAYAGNELIIDNQDSGFSIELGEWGTCEGDTCGGQPYGPDFRYASPREDGSPTPYFRARFTPQLPTAGDYEVYVWWPQGADRATDAPITVYHAGGESRFTVDLRNQGSHWHPLGRFSFIAGASGSVVMEDATTGYANADAVRFVQTTTGDVSYSGNFPATTPKVDDWAGLTQATLTINGVPRDLLVYRPNASSQLPLLILLSPTGSDLWSNIADEFGRGNLTDFADREGVVLVLPMQRRMTRGDWDNHGADTPYYETAIDDGTPDNQVNAPVSSDPNVNPDLLLVRAAIQEAQRAYLVDASRIYVNGFSNGAFFSYFVAATLNQQIAAFAETGGGLVLSRTTYGEPEPCPVISLPGNSGEARSCAASGWTPDACVSAGAMPRPIAPSSVARVPPGFLEANDDDDVVPFAHTCNLAHHLSGEHTVRIIHEGGGHIVNTDYLDNSWNFLKTHRLTATPAQTLIGHYYQAILGRAPDAGGLAYWTGEVHRTQSLGIDIQEAFRVMAGQFFTSTEYLSQNASDAQYVADLYETFFNRDPDSDGLNFWTGQLTGGLPRDIVMYAFLFSTEFGSTMQGLFGNTATRAEINAVVDFYRGLLGRLPDDDGFNYWRNQFRAAQCQGAAAVSAAADAISRLFITSQEYVNRARNSSQYVQDLYYAFLRRGADLNGFNYWVSQLDSGVLSREQARQAFVASPEFQGRVSQIIAEGCLP